MAGLSTKDIKLRIRSMESTKQITRAMEMVAASKLRRAQERALTSRPYFETLYGTMCDIAASQQDTACVYFQVPQGNRVCYIVIAGDRGLAGGYNSNILKLVWSQMQEKEACVLPIGKKALEFFRLRKARILTEQYADASEVTVGDCFSMARMLAKDFAAGEFDTIALGYTNFVSVLSQQPATLQLLPLSPVKKTEGLEPLTLCEPDASTVLAAIIPEYLGGLVYGALCESVASEQAARRTAMDSATKNAEDMIADLSLQYNRARQGAITQEITEIVAGSEH